MIESWSAFSVMTYTQARSQTTVIIEACCREWRYSFTTVHSRMSLRPREKVQYPVKYVLFNSKRILSTVPVASTSSVERIQE